MELVGKLRACFFSCPCKGGTRSRLGGPKYFVSTDLNLNRALLTWPVARKIWYSKRKGKKKKREKGLVWETNMATVLWLVWAWPILRTWLQVLKGPEGCIASYKLVDVRNNTVTSQHGGLGKFSTVTFTSRSIGLIAMHASKLQVFFPLLTPVALIEITVKNQDVQNRQNVSRIVCLAYSTLQLSDWTHIERNALSTFVRSTYSSDLHWTTLPSAKDRVFFVLLGGDWGEGTGKRAVTDGKGAHVHCSTCSRGAYIDFSKAPYV